MKPVRFINHPVVFSALVGLILTAPLAALGRKTTAIVNGHMEIPAWLILLLLFIVFSLLAYAFCIKTQLRRSEKLYRSLSDITGSISAFADTFGKALEEMNGPGRMEAAVLQMYAGMKAGQDITAGRLESDLKLHREEALHCLERLADKGYLESAYTADSVEPSYRLSEKGRSYVAANRPPLIEDRGA